RLLAQPAPREVDARCEDQRHLRGDTADQHAGRRAPHPRILEQRAELKSRPDEVRPPSFDGRGPRAIAVTICVPSSTGCHPAGRERAPAAVTSTEAAEKTS